MKREPLAILLVEDDPDHAELIRLALEDHQVTHRFHHVVDGRAALDYLFRRGEYADPETSPSPDIVLLDLRIPKIDGLVVLKEIRQAETLRGLPVVVLTTSDDEPDAAKAHEYGANSYIVKPVDFETFTQVMADLGRQWLP